MSADFSKPTKTAGDPQPSRRRPWRTRCFRVAAAVGIPLLILLMSEGVLRLAGFGFPTDFFLEQQFNGRPSLIDNQEFGRRFFPPGLVRYPKPLVLPKVKPYGAIRIFVMGESAAMGDPQPRFGLPRMLEVLLRQRFPGRQIDVVNASMVAINSHVVLPIARECARRDADLWVVYMGNNEMIGPFGCISKFGAQAPPRIFIKASLALKATRVGQVMDAVLHRVRRGRQAREWEGMSLWKDQQIHPDAKSTARVYEHFERNLRAILNAGRRAGVPIVLCTVATNIKDCAPFKSVHGAACAPDDLQTWRAAYDQGLALERQGSFAEAFASYQRALTIDRQFAELCFRAARCALALGNAAEAQLLFREARDRDALQFRTDSRINDIIRQCAVSYRGRGVSLLDAEELLGTASQSNLAGNEFFYEHVHLNPAGNHLLARAIADRAAHALALGSPETVNRLTGEEPAGHGVVSKEWASESGCLEALGFTDWNRRQILDEIRMRMEQPPFTRQANHEESLARIRREIHELRSATKPFQLQRASRQATQAVAQRPDDSDLRWNLAELLDASNEIPGAEEQWRAVIRLLPHSHLPYYNLGKRLERNARAEEAAELYRQCLRLKPDFIEARTALKPLLDRKRSHGNQQPNLLTQPPE